MKKKRYTKLYEWQIKSKDAKCEKCGDNRNITVDHLIPVSFIERLLPHLAQDLNYNFEKNFVYLCHYCNRRKSADIDPKNPRTYEVLEEFIRLAKEYYLLYNK